MSAIRCLNEKPSGSPISAASSARDLPESIRYTLPPPNPRRFTVFPSTPVSSSSISADDVAVLTTWLMMESWTFLRLISSSAGLSLISMTPTAVPHVTGKTMSLTPTLSPSKRRSRNSASARPAVPSRASALGASSGSTKERKGAFSISSAA